MREGVSSCPDWMRKLNLNFVSGNFEVLALAFDLGMSSEQSRKVLEDIQRAKSKLLKDGAAASLGISYNPSPIPPGSSASGPFGASSNPNDLHSVHMSPLHRSAMQVLQQANMTSFGNFVAQDSHFGNSILPVIPRLEPQAQAGPSASASPVKTEK